MANIDAVPYAGKYETGAVAPAVRHMVFLDGLRGVAALYVVLQHAIQNGFYGLQTPRWLLFLSWGRDAVTVFIVISGFCLALPVVRSGRIIKGGALHFYRRRAFRILPPYYATLLLGILANSLFAPPGPRWVTFSNPLFRKALLLHIFLLHNWFPSIEYAFDGPLWSVAIECQIYVLFPLIVYFWRRFGSAWLIVGSFAVAHATRHHGNANYLFEFVLGVLAADLAMHKDRIKHLQWVFYLSLLAFVLYPNKSSATCDVIVGLGAASLMSLCSAGRFWMRPLLSFAPLTWLGGFSYSIYLIHGIVMIGYMDFHATPAGLAMWFPATGYPLLAVLTLVIVPLALVSAYLFHVMVERPFMSVHRARSIESRGVTAGVA